MIGDNTPTKDEDTGNTTLVIHSKGTTIPNTLIGLRVEINIITREVIELLDLANLRPTPIVLEL